MKDLQKEIQIQSNMIERDAELSFQFRRWTLETENTLHMVENHRITMPKPVKRERSNYVRRHLKRWWLFLPTFRELVISFFGPFVGLLIVAVMHYFWLMPMYHLPLIIPALGAVLCIVFGGHTSPYAQPKNLMVGNLIAAFCGVSAYKICGQYPWLAGPLGVAAAVMLEVVTKTIHPPSGAVALIGATAGPEIFRLGYLYMIFPVFFGSLIILMWTVFAWNCPTKKYPRDWLNLGCPRLPNN